MRNNKKFAKASGMGKAARATLQRVCLSHFLRQGASEVGVITQLGQRLKRNYQRQARNCVAARLLRNLHNTRHCAFATFCIFSVSCLSVRFIPAGQPFKIPPFERLWVTRECERELQNARLKKNIWVSESENHPRHHYSRRQIREETADGWKLIPGPFACITLTPPCFKFNALTRSTTYGTFNKNANHVWEPQTNINSAWRI